MLDILMYERSFERALEFAQQEIAKVIDGRHRLGRVCREQGAARRLQEPRLAAARHRRPQAHPSAGTPPYTGERVPFVYVIDADEADQLQSKRAEDPAYALEHGLELDLLYYVQQQLISPLATLLSLEYADAAQRLIAPGRRQGRLDAGRRPASRTPRTDGTAWTTR